MTPVHGKLEVEMKKDYSKMYEKKNVDKVDIKQDGLKIDDVVETEITPEGPVEKTVADVINESDNNVKIEELKKKEEKITKPFMVEITGNLNLNVRKKPMGDIITSLAPGAQARVLDASENGEWYQIESPKGFIMKKFTKKVK